MGHYTVKGVGHPGLPIVWSEAIRMPVNKPAGPIHMSMGELDVILKASGLPPGLHVVGDQGTFTGIIPATAMPDTGLGGSLQLNLTMQSSFTISLRFGKRRWP